jgi:outer membrane protein TolC
MPERQQDLVAYALGHRPELAALAARVNAISRSADFERAGTLPRLDLFANANYSNPNQRVFPQTGEFRGTWEAGAQATWVVSDLPGARASVASTRASAASLRAQAKAQEDQIRREVSAALQAVLDARSAIGTSQTALRAAEESYRVRRALFQNGRATSTELVDTELDLNRARLTALTVRLQYRVSRARLEYAIGRGEARPG